MGKAGAAILTGLAGERCSPMKWTARCHLLMGEQLRTRKWQTDADELLEFH